MTNSRLRTRTVLVVAAVVALLVAPLSESVAAAPKGRCDAGLLDPACEATKGATAGVKNAVGKAATAPMRAAAGGVMDSLTRWVADAAVALIGKVVDLMDETTDPRLGSGWFGERYEFMMGLGLLVLMPLLLIATIRAIVRQDLEQLLRSFFVYVPIAVIATFVAIYFVQALLAVTDEMSRGVSRAIGDDATRFLEGSSHSVSSVLGDVSVGGFLVFFGSLLLIVAGFLLWIELLIRSAGIYVCVFFFPFILAGLVWPSTAQWTRRLIETLVALILSKFVIVSIISLAVAAIGQPGEGGVSTVIGGAALLSLAAFSPFALFKLIPIAESAGIGHLEGMERRPGQAVRSGGWNVQGFVKEKVAQGRTTNAHPGAGAGRALGATTGRAAAGSAGAALAVAKSAGKVVGGGGGGLERGKQSTPAAQPATTKASRRGGAIKAAESSAQGSPAKSK